MEVVIKGVSHFKAIFSNYSAQIGTCSHFVDLGMVCHKCRKRFRNLHIVKLMDSLMQKKGHWKDYASLLGPFLFIQSPLSTYPLMHVAKQQESQIESQTWMLFKSLWFFLTLLLQVLIRLSGFSLLNWIRKRSSLISLSLFNTLEFQVSLSCFSEFASLLSYNVLCTNDPNL